MFVVSLIGFPEDVPAYVAEAINGEAQVQRWRADI
jgi:hypothetical protein